MLNLKKFLSALTLSVVFATTVCAAGSDDELSIMAAEQRKDNPTNVETYDEPPTIKRTPQPSTNQPSTNQPTVGMSNPIVSYGTFEDMVETLGYIPLYVPKSSGYSINYMAIIGGSVAEMRYGRRWETEVNLVVRTYKRPVGEELRDISGVHGVKWRVDLSGGTPIYLARISENSNAAAWSIGQYTFAAMAENLSFAAFRTLVFEELADLSAHYFIEF